MQRVLTCMDPKQSIAECSQSAIDAILRALG
jgi:hypothetical protein